MDCERDMLDSKVLLIKGVTITMVPLHPSASMHPSQMMYTIAITSIMTAILLFGGGALALANNSRLATTDPDRNDQQAALIQTVLNSIGIFAAGSGILFALIAVFWQWHAPQHYLKSKSVSVHMPSSAELASSGSRF